MSETSNGHISLRKLLSNVPYCWVEYRTFAPHGVDVFAGACEYKEGELTALDGDTYSLDDEFIKYEFSNNKRTLTVWYESRWVSSDDNEQKDKLSAVRKGVEACRNGFCFACPYNDSIKSTKGCKQSLFSDMLVQLKTFKEIKDTILEMKDSGGTADQKTICTFLTNLINVTEDRFGKEWG